MVRTVRAASNPAQYLLVFTFIVVFFGSSISINAQVKGWGKNGNGNLGIGNTATSQTSPITVGTLTDITSFGGGQEHTLALKSNGTVVAWGRNFNGQIGNGTVNQTGCFCIPSPTAVSNLTDVVQVSAGTEHSLALKADGTVWAWGENSVGQIGDGTQTSQSTPKQVGIGVAGFGSIVAIDAGSFHNLALKSDGTVWAWGSDFRGRVRGSGTNSGNVLSPIQVVGLANIISVSAGEEHSVALGNDAKVKVWGSNQFGQAGTGTSTLTGCLCLGITQSNIIGVGQISAGARYTTALKQDGTVWAWGNNERGEVGNGTTSIRSSTPAQVSNLTEIVEIEATGFHTIARRRNGTLLSWGSNEFGQVRASGAVESGVPTAVQVANVGTTEAVFGTSYYTSYASIPNAPTNIESNVKISGENFSLNFDTVAASGTTLINLIDPTAQSLTVPAGFKIQQNTIGYNIATTANYSNNISVCLAAPSVSSETLFNALLLYHGENGEWVDRTTSRDFRRKLVCGTVTSLSPFALGRPLFVTSSAVEASGRIVSASGRPIFGAQVTMTDSAGNSRTSISNFFGHYRIGELRAGETYIVEIRAKRHQFAPQAVFLNGVRNDLNFEALP